MLLTQFFFLATESRQIRFLGRIRNQYKKYGLAFMEKINKKNLEKKSEKKSLDITNDKYVKELWNWPTIVKLFLTGLDYKEMMEGHPYKTLPPVLIAANVHIMAKMANKLPNKVNPFDFTNMY